MNTPKAIILALEEVCRYHPEVVQVFYGVDTRWQFMDIDFNATVFDKQLDIGILEDAQDAVTNFPAAFSI